MDAKDRPYLPAADQLAEAFVVVRFMADTPGRNGRADAQLAGQGKHMLGLRLAGKLRRLPALWRDQAICRQLVRLLFSPLLPGRAQVVKEDIHFLLLLVQMQGHVGKLMQEGEPEMVKPVVAQRKRHHRSGIRQL